MREPTSRPETVDKRAPDTERGSPPHSNPTESAKASIQMLPVASGDLLFSAASGHEAGVPDRLGEMVPGYGGINSGDVPRNRDTQDMGKRSLSVPDADISPGEPQDAKESDDV